MKDLQITRNILCIDLKSFFASCECVDLGLDPFTTPLVVANPLQGNGAMTLAITPCLKAKGVKSRTRLYEIPENIEYQIAKPRMGLYIEFSQKVVDVYLDYVSSEDLYIYSIDECFLDVTDYLKLYKKNDYQLAEDILNSIQKKTGLTANCGIGPNMLLAKIAMDTDAKKFKNGITKWTYEDIPTKLWTIHPLSKMWGIGPRMEKNLNNMGFYTIGEIANADVSIFKKKFGIMGEELWNHANGIDLSVISDCKIPPKDKSFSHSQVLFKDYNEDNIKIIISEMIDVLTTRLRKEKKETSVIGLGIGYSKKVNASFYHTFRIENPTDSAKTIYEVCQLLFDKHYDYLPIRKVSISLGKISNKAGKQLNLFEDTEKLLEKEKINDAIDEIKDKFGKNSIIKASNLLQDSTAQERNNKIGGHSA